MKNPKQVISIGDSYMNWVSHTFQQDLDAAAGVTFRPTYAIGGTAMGSGGIGLIPTQFDTALAQDKDIIAVVMDGGGNDVLVPALGRPDCKNMANAGSVPGCQQIVTDALAASETYRSPTSDAPGERDSIVARVRQALTAAKSKVVVTVAVYLHHLRAMPVRSAPTTIVFVRFVR